MTGLDFLGSTLGVEGMDIAKMFGGLLSGAGGMMAPGKKDDKGDKAAAEKLKQLEEDKRKAEQSAGTLKTGLKVGGALAVGAAGLYWFKVRK